MTKVTYVDAARTVIERIDYSVNLNDPDGRLARKWADEYYSMKGNYSGIDGFLDARFREIGRPDAVSKFVRL